MRLSFSLVFILHFLLFSAQSVINDPKSSYGFGERSSGSHSIFSALGRNDVQLCDSSVLNFKNPASYSFLSPGSTLYSVDIQTRISKFQQNGTSEYAGTAMAEHFVLGFKIHPKMGMAFGLKPFATRGYSFSERVSTGADSLLYSYLGKGTINSLFLGYAYQVVSLKKTQLSLGFNAAYLFGSLYNERMASIIQNNNNQGGVSRQYTATKSFQYQIGLMYRQQLTERHHISLSGIIEPSQNLSSSYRNEFITASDIGLPSTYSTLSNESVTGKIELGMRYEAGLAYDWYLRGLTKNNKVLHPKMTFLLSYGAGNPDSHNFPGISQWNLTNSNKFAFGIQFMPEYKLFENVTTLKLFEKWQYRAGLFQQTLPYQVNNTVAFDQGFTFGFGIPILVQQSLSSVNVGFTMGRRSVDAASSLQQEYLGINFGLILAPSNFEKWFRKRKLD